jgi:DNA polymerase V
MKAIVDCNSFYASCEKVFRPELEGRPIVVLSNNDGCIIARNEEAKFLGIPMGEPHFKAKELIQQHNIAVFSSNYALYGDMSRRVMLTLADINPQIEVYSVDEAFLDLSTFAISNLEEYGRFIKEKVGIWTGIPVSVGIARTKTLAKVANRLSKKHKTQTGGVMVLDKTETEKAALISTSVEDVWGVGRRYARFLRLSGVENALQLSQQSEIWAQKNLGGVVGVRLIRELNGIPCIELGHGAERKQMIASTRSFGNPVKMLSEMKEAIATYTSRAAEKLRLQKSAAGCIYVFMSTGYFDLRQAYEKDSLFELLQTPTANTNELIEYALRITEKAFRPGTTYKKAGVILSALVDENAIQTSLFEPDRPDPRGKKLANTIDLLNKRLVNDKVRFAATGMNKDWKTRSEVCSPEYSTKWKDIPLVGAFQPSRGSAKQFPKTK